MTPARISCPLSHALTFLEILPATSSTRGRSLRGNSRANAGEQGIAVDQQIKRQDEDGDNRDDAAERERQRRRDRSHGVAGPRRILKRLFEREVVIQQSMPDQELLSLIDELGCALPQVLRLIDERRHDEQTANRRQEQDAEIDDENGKPSRQRARAFRHRPLDAMHKRTEAGREHHADVRDQNGVACDVQRSERESGQRRYRHRTGDGRIAQRRKSAVKSAIRRYTVVSSSSDARKTIRK